MSKFLRLSVFLLALVVAIPVWAGDSGDHAGQVTILNTEYNRLLGEYVFDHLVDYNAWTANKADKSALDQYVDQMAALDPAAWPRDEALAYWLNLYNAVTLQLVLNNYPLGSIKDIGGFMKKSPWKRELVTVGGRVLTLNNIENEVKRYIGMPGQALAYMIGRREIMRLRSEAMTSMGDRFDIKGFHDTVLGSGPVPLGVLGDLVTSWASA